MKNNRKKVHRKWLLGNRDGSTLMLVVISLMLVSIAIIAFQTAVVSFTTRTLTQHYEKQAYLSARSVAQAIVDKIEADSELMESGGSADLSGLLEDLYSLSVDDSIELENISFAGLTEDGVDLDAGVVEAYIHRVDATTYVVEAIADVNGDTDSVEIALDGTAISAGGGGGQVEVEGNWDGFYSDFGIGLSDGHSYTMNDDDDSIVTGTVTHYDMGGELYRGNIYSAYDLILENITMDAGNVQTEGNITLRDNVTVNSIYLKAGENIIVEGSVTWNVTTISKELYITGNNSQLNTGPFIAEYIEISGNNVVVNGPIYCDTLVVTGSNVVFQNSIYTNDSTLNTDTTALSVFALDGDASAETIYSQIEELDSFYVADRTKPLWANYEDSSVSEYVVGTTMVNEGYYTLPDSMLGTTTTSTETIGDTAIDVTWSQVNLGSISKGWSDTVYIVVEDGQNILLEPYYSANIYFILEGNAKLKFMSAGSWDFEIQTRIYGETVSNSTYEAIQNAVEDAVNRAGVGAEYDDVINTVMAGYWDDMSVLILGDHVRIVGSAVVPYILMEGSSSFREVNYSDNVLDFDDSSTWPEDYDPSATGSSGGGSSFMSFDFDAYVN